MSKLEQAIQRARQRSGFENQTGYLGRGDGNPRDPRTSGNLWVRFLLANNTYSQAISLPVDGNANLIVKEGSPVEVGMNSRGLQCILRADSDGLRAAGISPLILNPLDETAHSVQESAYLAPFYYTRHPDTENEPLSIVVYPQPLLVDGVLQNAGYTVIRLTDPAGDESVDSLIPPENKQCWAVVFWNTTTQRLEAFASAEEDMGDVLPFEVLQEAIAQAGSASVPICGRYLFDDMETLDDDKKRWIDLRQWINVPGGEGGLVAAADVTFTPADDADWDTPPDDAAEALDYLAEKVRDLIVAAAVYPRRASLSHDESTAIAGNAVTIDTTATFSAQLNRFVAYQFPAANADAFTHPFMLQAGTYTIYFHGYKDGNLGKIDWYLDAEVSPQISAQDWYAPSTTLNVILSASITVTGDGYHVLKGVVNGKHASSTDYFIGLTKMYIKPATD